MIEAHGTNIVRQTEIQLDGGPGGVGVAAGFGLHFWRGASGRRYLHAVYSLLGCPDLPASNFVLVRREHDQSITVVLAGAVSRSSGSANLATIRQTAARLGANEVHVLTSETSDLKRQQIASDIATANSALVAAGAASFVKRDDVALSLASPSLAIH